MEIKNYKHSINEAVKFHEVDMLGICNNAVYFNYFEDARLKYVQDIVKKFKLRNFLSGDSFFIMVRNECDYIEPAYLDDELKIHTKIDYIKNSSFGFKHLVKKVSSGKIIAKGGGAVVHINKTTNQSIPLPQEFYDAVKEFEGEVKIVKQQ
ncbi:MAG: acyl-CoA thioesterase [Ignavibacteriae bacterium]|nr:acyl-CoA thioesterase [Ignavibacteriota bacterium]NOG99706.1 acyl-CoA thioesterase [Ignavibacteriota bacterium]